MKRTMMTMLSLIFFLAVLSACSEEKNISANVFGKGAKGPEAIFSNTAWVNMLVKDEKKEFDTQVYNVTFEPNARTYWHSHKGGQILLVTSGKGYYQEKGNSARILAPGDVVTIPSGVIHWHGAASNSEFVHLGMSTQVEKGPADWFGPVTDEEYGKAIGE